MKLDLNQPVNLSALIDPESGERKYLNMEERDLFKQAAQYQKPDIKALTLMYYYTGCRLNEALALFPDSFRYEDQTVMMRTLKQRPKRKKQDPKKAKKKEPVYRRLSLPQSYLDFLESQYSAASRSGKHNGKARLWSFTDRTARKYVKLVMNEAGIDGKKATSRGLRHSVGVMLAMKKWPLHTIAEILGHSEIKNTLIYTRIVGQERREVMESIW